MNALASSCRRIARHGQPEKLLAFSTPTEGAGPAFRAFSSFTSSSRNRSQLMRSNASSVEGLVELSSRLDSDGQIHKIEARCKVSIMAGAAAPTAAPALEGKYPRRDRKLGHVKSKNHT